MYDAQRIHHAIEKQSTINYVEHYLDKKHVQLKG